MLIRTVTLPPPPLWSARSASSAVAMCRRPLLLALTALLALLPACHGLSCYYCRGTTRQSSTAGSNTANLVPLRTLNASKSVGIDYSCARFDPSLDKYKIFCTYPYDKSCGKNVASDGETVMRSCADGAGTTCTKFSDGSKQCLCTSDYCNSAGLTAPALLLLLPAALLAAIYSRQ